MKLTCDACKLTLNARDEDRGKSFTCPICRGPLREADGTAAKPAEEPKKSPAPALEWSGGTLDDLVYMVNSQALAAVLEVHAPEKKGEVHVIAGGVDDAFANGARGDEAMEALRNHDGARFRVELRLPSDAGSLAAPNADRGDLKARPLAKLMRYCEEYVLTCDLEAWRGSETCRVEYRRGNIARTLINGIDAPEQLADVMGWTSGNYRFVLPRLALPKELDQASRAQARAAAETRISEQKAARKTIFGMPAAHLMGVMAQQAAQQQQQQAQQPQAAAAPASPAPAVREPPAQKTMFMGSAGAPAQAAAAAHPAPAAANPPRGDVQKTMLGMPQASGSPANAGAAAKTMPVGPTPAPGPSSVVIDSAYAAASNPGASAVANTNAQAAAAAVASSDEVMRNTARGFQPAAKGSSPPATSPKTAAIDNAGDARKKDKRPMAEPARPRERPPSTQKTTGRHPPMARRPDRSLDRPATTSPWVNVGIAVSVAVGIVVIWLIVSMFTR